MNFIFIIIIKLVTINLPLLLQAAIIIDLSLLW